MPVHLSRLPTGSMNFDILPHFGGFVTALQLINGTGLLEKGFLSQNIYRSFSKVHWIVLMKQLAGFPVHLIYSAFRNCFRLCLGASRNGITFVVSPASGGTCPSSAMTVQ